MLCPHVLCLLGSAHLPSSMQPCCSLVAYTRHASTRYAMTQRTERACIRRGTSQTLKPRNSFTAALAMAQNAERSASMKTTQRQLSPRPQGAVAAAAAALASLPKFTPPVTPAAEHHKYGTELYLKGNSGAALALSSLLPPLLVISGMTSLRRVRLYNQNASSQMTQALDCPRHQTIRMQVRS